MFLRRTEKGSKSRWASKAKDVYTVLVSKWCVCLSPSAFENGTERRAEQEEEGIRASEFRATGSAAKRAIVSILPHSTFSSCAAKSPEQVASIAFLLLLLLLLQATNFWRSSTSGQLFGSFIPSLRVPYNTSCRFVSFCAFSCSAHIFSSAFRRKKFFRTVWSSRLLLLLLSNRIIVFQTDTGRNPAKRCSQVNYLTRVWLQAHLKWSAPNDHVVVTTDFKPDPWGGCSFAC